MLLFNNENSIIARQYERLFNQVCGDSADEDDSDERRQRGISRSGQHPRQGRQAPRDEDRGEEEDDSEENK